MVDPSALWPWLTCFIVIIFIFFVSLYSVVITDGRFLPRRLLECCLPANDRSHDAQEEDPRQKRVSNKVPHALVFNQELWQAGYGSINPYWLLVYRFIIFIYCFSVFIYDAHRGSLFELTFFTRWNFMLLTTYFGIASYFSFKACSVETKDCQAADDSTLGELCLEMGNAQPMENLSVESQLRYLRICKPEEEKAGPLGYIMQGLYQIILPCSVLVDSVFWVVLYPEAVHDNHAAGLLNFVSYNEHGFNLAICVGEFALNSMRYPWFRVAYVLLWSLTYVIFQWIWHDVFGQRWCYSFLVNNVPVAPLWYIGLLLFLFVCFSLWVQLHRMKIAIHDMPIIRTALYTPYTRWVAYLTRTAELVHKVAS